MKSTRIVFLLCLLAILVAVFPAAAQEETFGLSAEDFALMTGTQFPEDAAFNLASQFGLAVDGTDVSWDLAGSGLFASDMFSLLLNGSLTSAGSDTPLNIELRGVDGSLYISPDGGTNWFGGTAEEIEQMLSGFTSSMGSSLPVNPEDLASGDMSDLMAQPGVMEAIMAISSIDPTTFVTIVRDADVDGSAHFTTTVDIAALVASPELAPVIASAAAGSMDTTANDVTEEQLQQMSAMMASMFQGSSLVLDQYVNLATNEASRLTLTLALTLPSKSGTSNAINLTLDLGLSDIGDATVVAPESFEPISQAMGALMGGM
ncbi:MAG: hypothetical protein UZ15_CFX003000746 [Chloroflexi bacterium OLB15]|nr:MAG: hypothetical protein UZ15_CFX003000746 [Chloroflexi bacterium OLB15]